MLACAAADLWRLAALYLHSIVSGWQASNVSALRPDRAQAVHKWNGLTEMAEIHACRLPACRRTNVEGQGQHRQYLARAGWRPCGRASNSGGMSKDERVSGLLASKLKD